MKQTTSFPGGEGKRKMAVILLLIVSLNAFAAGFGFMSDPSGNALGMTTEYLRYAPFRNFFIPGMVLFIINGMMPLAIAVMAILHRPRYQDLIFLQGVVLNMWITIQVLMLRDFHLLHGLCLVVGIALMRLGREMKSAAQAD